LGPRLRSVRNHGAEPIQGVFEDGHRGAEREAHVLDESGGPSGSTFAGVHVEEVAWHANDLPVERCLEEVIAVAK
jgi:hypothetical protein